MHHSYPSVKYSTITAYLDSELLGQQRYLLWDEVASQKPRREFRFRFDTLPVR